MARHVRKAIIGDSSSYYEPEESDDSDDNDDRDSELSMFGDPDDDNFSHGDDYYDSTIAQMFENRRRCKLKVKKRNKMQTQRQPHVRMRNLIKAQ